MATATAHPNIALVKYWGKQDKPGNFPATPSLSITLDTLATETTVVKSDQDSFHLAGSQVKDAKVTKFLAGLRGHFDVPPLAIETQNNFPTGAGLASSASGFAALITAINEECGLGLEVELASEWARMGSASAARSMFGGYVSLVPPLWRAQPTAPASHWPLAVVVAITSTT
ncbi:MAG: diphosphomevalonate decarboxylase, partial [Candidatus Azotimanducaceae bacterium]